MFLVNEGHRLVSRVMVGVWVAVIYDEAGIVRRRAIKWVCSCYCCCFEWSKLSDR